MAIDIKNEELLTVPEAAKRTPTGACESTVWKWILDRKREIRLESVLVGGRRLTSAEALERFYDRLTKADEAQKNEEVTA